ncbi:MAG: hypothetical protein KBD78_02435 [Oligoflexales bacterium]|nr:hypothetical protein [Oligoflexales bacterium]
MRGRSKSVLFLLSFALALSQSCNDSKYINYKSIQQTPINSDPIKLNNTTGTITAFLQAPSALLSKLDLTKTKIIIRVFSLNENSTKMAQEGTDAEFNFSKDNIVKVTLEDLQIGLKEIDIYLYQNETLLAQTSFQHKVIPGLQEIEEAIVLKIDSTKLQLPRQDSEVNITITKEQLNFDLDIRPIISQYCTYACHTNSRATNRMDANIELETYPFVNHSQKITSISAILEESDYITKASLQAMERSYDKNFEDPVFGDMFVSPMPKDTTLEGVKFNGIVPKSDIQLIRRWFIEDLAQRNADPNTSASNDNSIIESIVVSLKPKDNPNEGVITFSAVEKNSGNFSGLAKNTIIDMEYEVSIEVFAKDNILLSKQSLGYHKISKDQSLALVTSVNFEAPQLQIDIRVEADEI